MKPVTRKPRRAVPQATDTTRQALIEAATTVFAEHGYVRGSVRQITRAAGANQAAITYHFGGKDELYRTILRQAIQAFGQHSLINVQNVHELDLAEGVRRIIRQFLLPLLERGRLGRYVQIFGWETIDPSPVYTKFFIDERPQVFTAIEQFLVRCLPGSNDAARVSFTAFWLIQQPIAIVRNSVRLQQPPYNLTFDEAGIDRLVENLADLSLRGLTVARA